MYLEIFQADFVVFRVVLGISRVRDRAKYQKPCIDYVAKNWALAMMLKALPFVHF